MQAIVELRPDLERFARGCVASGQFHDLNAVVQCAIELLRTREAVRDRLREQVESAQHDVDRHGAIGLDELLRDLDEIHARGTP